MLSLFVLRKFSGFQRQDKHNASYNYPKSLEGFAPFIGKDSANRRQNKINSFIFYVEVQPILSKDRDCF